MNFRQSFLSLFKSGFFCRNASNSCRHGVTRKHWLAIEELESRISPAILPEEQLFVYLTNKARNNPVAYQQATGLPVDLSYIPPTQPLAINTNLFASASFHANEMAKYNYVGHQSPITGDWPNKMVRDAGYDLEINWQNNSNQVECAGGGSATAELALYGGIYDEGQAPGHRHALLTYADANDYGRLNNEIGVGFAFSDRTTYKYHWSIHIAHQNKLKTYLTGVVFDDNNQNGYYDLGEGLPDINVSNGEITVSTNSQGGYSFPVSDPNGVYMVTASGGAFAGRSSVPVKMNGKNIEIDFVSGFSTGYLAFKKWSNTAPQLDPLKVALFGPVKVGVLDPKGSTALQLLADGAVDPDPLSKKGIAVFDPTESANGKWQYSTNAGLAWLDLRQPTQASALLLSECDRVRFIPNSGFVGTPSISYRAWDQTQGSIGVRWDVSTGSGGTSAFSSAVAKSTIAVIASNTAPTLSNSTVTKLPDIPEDSTNPAGGTVRSLLGSRATDPDPGTTAGMALVGATGMSGGTWQYSLDNGGTWKSITQVSEAKAVLLQEDNKVRFVPNKDFNGSALIRLRAWDQMVGLAGDVVDLTGTNATGGSSSFSTAFAESSVLVTPVNDAPVIVPGSSSFMMKPVAVGATTLAGMIIADFNGNGVVDVDFNASLGIAVIGTKKDGTFYFNTGNGWWYVMGDISPRFAVIVRKGDQIGFLPNNGFSGLTSFTFRGWDQTTGNLSDRVVDLTKEQDSGGTTAYSAEIATGFVFVGSAGTGPTVDVVDISPDPRSTDVGDVTFQFSEDVSGFDIGDLTLTLDSKAVDISSRSITKVSGSKYTVNLAGLTTQGGVYKLSVKSSGTGITDSVGNMLSTGASDSWSRIGGQTITFAALGTATYGVKPVTLQASGGGSGNPVTFTVISGPGAINGSELTVNGAGSIVVEANQAGNATFAAADPVRQTLTVTKASLTITAENKTKVYGAALPVLTTTVAGLVNGDTTAKISGLKATTSAKVGSSVGDYAIKPEGTSSNYDITLVDGVLSVTKAALTITADNKTKVYGAGVPVLTTTVTGLVNGDTTANITGLGASTTATASSAVGDYPVKAAGTIPNYDVKLVDGTLAITKAVLTIAGDAKSKVYGAALPVLTTTVTGLVNGDMVAKISGLAATTTATVFSNAGDYAIKVAGTIPNYDVKLVDGVLSVTKASLTITAENKAKVYGAALPVLTTTVTGLVNGDTVGKIIGLTATTTATASSNTGGHIIRPAGTNANYEIKLVDGVLSVTKAALTIAADNKSKVYGAALPVLTTTLTGLVNGDTAAQIVGLKATTSATAVSNTGDHVIRAEGSSDNYSISFLNGTLTITKASLTIQADSKSMAPGGAVPVLTATYTGLVNNDSPAVVNGLRLSTAANSSSPIGSYPIKAEGGTAANYAITHLDGVINVGQAIAFPPLASRTYGSGVVTLQATGGPSGNPVVFSLISGPGTLQGNSLTINGAGDIVIEANQKGNSTYPDASPVRQTLRVNKAPLTIAAENKSKVYGAALPTLTTVVTGLVNGDTTAVIAGLSASTLATAASGVASYAIQAAGTSANYEISAVDGVLSITQAPLTIRADDKGMAPGAQVPALTATITGLVNGDTASAVQGLALSTTASSSSPSGNYPITGSGASSPNYSISYISGVLSVGQAPSFTSVGKALFTVAKSGEFLVTANGSPAPSFSIEDGKLPAGLNLSQDGKISGVAAKGSAGAYALTIRATNAGGFALQNLTVEVSQPGVFAVAAMGGGSVSRLAIYENGTNRILRTLEPFPGFKGEFYVDSGDISGDGVEDIIVGSGKGSLNGHVVVFDGARLINPGAAPVEYGYRQEGSVRASLYAFVGYSSGVAVRLADMNDDGCDDIVLAPGTGAGANTPAHLRVWDGKTSMADFESGKPLPYDYRWEMASFWAFGNSSNPGGGLAISVIRQAGADLIIASQLFKGGSKVFRYDGNKVLAQVDDLSTYLNLWPNGNTVVGIDLPSGRFFANAGTSRSALDTVFVRNSSNTRSYSIDRVFGGSPGGLRLGLANIDNDTADELIVIRDYDSLTKVFDLSESGAILKDTLYPGGVSGWV